MREAIKRWEADRLLVPFARKGFYVPTIDIREYLYVLELRLPIERYAFVTAATRASDAERIALEQCISKFRRALRKEDQRAFDELWTHISKHLMAVNLANHLLPFETFLLAMLLEEHKEIIRLRGMVEEMEKMS